MGSVFADGSKYEGQFVADNFNGKGVMQYVEGGVYKGSFVNGERHGCGVFYWSNGGKYSGQFAGGKFNGIGAIRHPNGKVDYCAYANDQCISPSGLQQITKTWNGRSPTIQGFKRQPNDPLHPLQERRPVLTGPPCVWSDGEIHIRCLNGKTVTIAASSTDTIGAVKRKIAKKEGAPPGQQRLIYKAKMLEDGKCLGDYQCHCKATVFLVVQRQRQSMNQPTSWRQGRR